MRKPRFRWSLAPVAVLALAFVAAGCGGGGSSSTTTASSGGATASGGTLRMAIGSEPPDPSWDSSGHWQRVMQGHAGANLMPLVAANRFGREVGVPTEYGGTREITFYGSSFIADHTGAKVVEAGRGGEAVLTAAFDLEELRTVRHSWGLFRDRRPETYGPLLTSDGRR